MRFKVSEYSPKLFHFSHRVWDRALFRFVWFLEWNFLEIVVSWSVFMIGIFTKTNHLYELFWHIDSRALIPWLCRGREIPSRRKNSAPVACAFFSSLSTAFFYSFNSRPFTPHWIYMTVFMPSNSTSPFLLRCSSKTRKKRMNWHQGEQMLRLAIA